MSAEVREMFELNIESTAEWRSRKAVEYPEDSRNEQSSTALVKLLKYVRELSDNHAIFRALAYYSETEVDEQCPRTYSRLRCSDRQAPLDFSHHSSSGGVRQ